MEKAGDFLFPPSRFGKGKPCIGRYLSHLRFIYVFCFLISLSWVYNIKALKAFPAFDYIFIERGIYESRTRRHDSCRR